MKTTKLIVAVLILIAIGFGTNHAINNNKKSPDQLDTRIDNQGYWLRAAKKGLVDYNPEIVTKAAIYTGSKIFANTVSTLDSPDIPVTEVGSTQSENSVFVNPLDENNVLNSNNSTNSTVDTAYGANALFSFSSGETWEGDIEGAGTDNAGDPAAIIGLNGRWYVNFINTSWGMGVSYSDDQGATWTVRQAAPNPGIITDKNHMWIDNNPLSPFEGNLYVAWTNAGGLFDAEIGISYSSDDGETWTVIDDISSGVNAGILNHGVNLSTGPNGEVYAMWSIYDTWPSGGSDETAIGMTLSLDGGITWEPAQRIITNIRGIRATKTGKDMRVNSFPVATVDNSSGADNGAIYVTWANIGVPGINTGEDIDVYVIKSSDKGDTWTVPLKVNSDESGLGKQHFFPWITCDPANGILSMIYYDDRNVDTNQCEVYCANSVDGGSTWEEFKVSDISFTPAPIPGLVDKYMGDYLGIHSKNGKVYPVWTDNRLGYAMSYCSPYETNPVNRPINLIGEVEFETGIANLIWSYEEAEGFLKFIIYRDGDSITSTSDTTFSEILPLYGLYSYRVTAYYTDNIESGASGIYLRWGDVIISVSPDELSDHLSIGGESFNHISIINEGQLDLEYSISLESRQSLRGYCDASGGGGAGNEYISGVEVGNISNLNTGSDNYTDYSNMSTTMKVGQDYSITVTNGHPFDFDQCGVWVDWNANEIFEENELVVLETIPGTDIFTGSLSPLPGSVSGVSKMRVRITYTGDLDPCGNTNFGEVEDYSIFVSGWLDIFPQYGIVPAGDTNLISVNFNAINLPEGYYSTNAVITSNDPTNSIVEVPLSLRADQIVVVATSNHSEVCSGQIVVLMANITGVFDSLSFVWTSVPEGFNSTISRPLALPLVSSWYRVEVTDGDHYSIDSVFVEVLPLPEVNLGSDTSLCGSVTGVLDAGSSGSTFLWSTGDTTQTIIIDTIDNGYGIQTISVEVTDSIGCTGSDEINIDFVNCTGIDDQDENRLKIYPNPNKGKFYVDLGNITGNYLKLDIINIFGITVYQSSNLPQQGGFNINIGKHDNGVYTMVLSVDEHVFTKKIIVNN